MYFAAVGVFLFNFYLLSTYYFHTKSTFLFYEMVTIQQLTFSSVSLFNILFKFMSENWILIYNHLKTHSNDKIFYISIYWLNKTKQNSWKKMLRFFYFAHFFSKELLYCLNLWVETEFYTKLNLIHIVMTKFSTYRYIG